MSINENAIKVVISDGSEAYVFADKRGGVTTPESRLASAKAGTGNGFVNVKLGKDRNSESDYVNIDHIVRYSPVGLPIPTEIENLYKAPEKETDEEAKIRTDKIKEYYNQI